MDLIHLFQNQLILDYLNFYIFGYDYPVFNIADIFIVLGIIYIIAVILTILDFIKKHKKESKHEKIYDSNFCSTYVCWLQYG